MSARRRPDKPRQGRGGDIYTCPMHPRSARSDGQLPDLRHGTEAELATAETGPNPELVDMTRRFWIGLGLAIPVAALEIAGASPTFTR